MPLRDHFHPPLELRMPWDALHGGWPMVIVQKLQPYLPGSYVAVPLVHLGASAEIDVGTYEVSSTRAEPTGPADVGLQTAVWAPPDANLAIADVLPEPDEYAVRVFDVRRRRRLVAAVELVSPSNKDRPEHRRALLGKCAGMLREGVCVAIVDLVTSRTSNMFEGLLDFLGQAETAALAPRSDTSLHAASCRLGRRDSGRLFEAWSYPLTLGQLLPTLPLWLSEDLAIPLDLEASYEETCRTLRIA